MKKSIISFFGIIFLLLATNIFSQSQTEIDDAAKHEAAMKKPFAGVCCTDETIRLDCVCKLGELKSDKALFTLMKILREDPCEAVRIAAAQSLVKMGDPRGVFLVARHAKFSDSEKVSRFCEKFFQAYQYQEYLAKHGVEETDGNGYALTSVDE
jgi:hypothetical protein